MIRNFKTFLSSDKLKARTLRGTLASLWLAGGSQILRFGSNLVLTRLLFPEAFGLMALVQVILGGMLMLSDAGLRGSVVQNPRGDDPAFLNTIWSVQILRGILLWMVISLLGGVFASIFGRPELVQILPVAALSLVFRGFHTTKALTVQRHMQLGQHASLTLISQVIGLIATAVLAYALQSVWALVIGMLFQPMAALVLYARYLDGIKNRLGWDRASLRDIFNLGKFLTVSSVANYIMDRSDRAVLGTIIAIDLLGIYGIALALAMMPMTVAKRIAGSVMFPLYRMRHPVDSLPNRKNLFKVRRVLIGTGLGLLGIIAFAGPWLIEVLYDDRYIAAGAISVLIAAAFTPRMLMMGAMHATVAKGDSFSMMMVNLSTALIQIAFLILLVPRFEILGAAIAIGLARILTYPLAATYLSKYDCWDKWGDLTFFIVTSGAMSYALWLHWADILDLLL